MRTVYLAMACWNYEGSNPLRAFASKPAAERLAQQCEKHRRAEPPCPRVEDTPENDLLWQKWEAAKKRWEKRAPKHFESADFYSVRKIGFTPNRRTEERNADERN